MSSRVIFLGTHPRPVCLACNGYERDKHQKAYCRLTWCPVGLIHRKKRQRPPVEGPRALTLEVEGRREKKAGEAES